MLCLGKRATGLSCGYRAALRILAIALTAGAWLLPSVAFADAGGASDFATANTVVTVDTVEDKDSGSITKTCTYLGGVYVPATDGCTLRRALLEASARPQSDRPIEIRFNLANGDAEANGTWVLPVDDDLPLLDTPSILDKNGSVTIDGDTQPGGRASGPKIIVNTKDHTLQVDSENNVIRNLSFRGGGQIFLMEDGNTIEDIWMGLADDGQSIAFRTPGQPERMAGGGVRISADNNIVRSSVISGAFTKAIEIAGGDNNLVELNFIGTRADGSVPAVPEAAQCLRSLLLDPQNWYGGWGVRATGTGNRILNNLIAGLHVVQSASSSPPTALEVSGADHEIAGNVIGLDAASAQVGVCGQGMVIGGNGTQIVENVIVSSRSAFGSGSGSAMLAPDSSPSFGQITVRGNLVENGPGALYRFGSGVSQSLRNFKPAQITSIEGTTVSGESGENSPCAGCLVDFYLDDTDGVAEALEHLGSVVANADGTFTFMLSQELTDGMGIRTMSTTQSAGVIGSFLAGTTTMESDVVYTPAPDSTGTPGVLLPLLVK